jgi:hypothetical protein
MTIFHPTRITALALAVAALGLNAPAFAGGREQPLLDQFRAGQSSDFGAGAPMALPHAAAAPALDDWPEAALLDWYQAGKNNDFGSGTERVHGMAAAVGPMPSRAALEAQYQVGKNIAFSNSRW